MTDQPIIIIVHTDEAAEALSRLLPNLQSAIYADDMGLDRFQGRSLVLWPSVGSNFEDLVDKLTKLPKPPERITLIEPEDARDLGWDAHYAEQDGMQGRALDSWIQSRAKLLWPADKVVTFPFKCLGHNKGRYYFLPRGTGQVVDLGPRDMALLNYLHLYPDIGWWIKQYPKDNTTERNKDAEPTLAAQAAASDLIGQCQHIGIFNQSKIRGRGVWVDKINKVKCSVVHAGDRVLAEGRSYAPFDTPSDHVYEMSPPLIVGDLSIEMNDSEGATLSRLFNTLSWKERGGGTLLAGWLMCATVGGALEWRPHIWLSGRRGSGKTTVVDLLCQILGRNYVMLQGSTSEAGIRQTLGNDSLPVLLDEAEKEDQASGSRLQQVLQLIRGGRTAKGTPSGKALTFEVRSCFAFSSINAAAVRAADKSRVTVLELGLPLEPDAYAKWRSEFRDLLAAGLTQKLYARAVRLAPIIRHNASLFATEISKRVSDQRMGDQLGALLAGAFAVQNSGVVTSSQIIEFIKGIDLNSQQQELEGQSDEHALFDFIMEQVIPVGNVRDTYSVGQVAYALLKPYAWNENFSHVSAEQALATLGMKVADGGLIVSNTHAKLGALLEKTRWAGTSWSKSLLRMPGAKNLDKKLWFAGSQSRCIMLPLEIEAPMFTETQEPQYSTETYDDELPFDS